MLVNKLYFLKIISYSITERKFSFREENFYHLILIISA